MEAAQRISDYIKGSIDQGNLLAYNILIHIAFEMLSTGHTEEDVKKRIDQLLTDPVEFHGKK